MTTDNLAARTKQSNKELLTWTSSWLVSLAIVAFAPKFVWDFSPVYTLMALILNLFFGYKMIIANKRALDRMDELQRRIHFNAMAVSLGISMVFGAAYGLMEGVKLINFEPNPSGILFVMGISYLISVFVGLRKYA